MYNQFMNPNVDRINRQIEDLNNLKQQMMQPQAPINNYINTTPQVEFEARILKDNETADTVIAQRKTAFIDLNNCKLTIKEVDGNITAEYDILKPKDAKDLKIEELERKLEEMERRMNNAKSNANNKPIQQEQQPKTNDGEHNKF